MNDITDDSSTIQQTPSLRELAKLSLVERHRILAIYVPMMVEDFSNIPELMEFSALDDDWEE
ncbi:MAG: hypothetical protein HC860_11485 [Alkalinema sp. RU_4_3]|nr:hypothetical protein [Alkalinema sp. RU_4_3]